MGVQLSKRPMWRGAKLGLATLFALGLLTLTGCSSQTMDEWQRAAMPEPGTDEGWQILEFWQWSWVALLATGVLVWGLMFYSAWRFRRRDDDEVPVQTRYNLPLEIFYTIAPIIMVLVFFAWTVDHQAEITAIPDDPDHTVVVVGQQWSWTFNYVDEEVADGKNVFEFGTASYIPTLVLPVDQTIRFELHSPDVIHSFWVTGFLYKEDIIPGKQPPNDFVVTTDREGSFVGKCAELCGASHARMLFNVEIVSQEEYDAYLQDQIDAGFWSDDVLLGGEESVTQAGLETELPEGGTE